MAEKSAFDYVNEIWGIANYVRDVIRPADYNKLILTFAVLRSAGKPPRAFGTTTTRSTAPSRAIAFTT